MTNQKQIVTQEVVSNNTPKDQKNHASKAMVVHEHYKRKLHVSRRKTTLGGVHCSKHVRVYVSAQKGY